MADRLRFAPMTWDMVVALLEYVVMAELISPDCRGAVSLRDASLGVAHLWAVRAAEGHPPAVRHSGFRADAIRRCDLRASRLSERLRYPAPALRPGAPVGGFLRLTIIISHAITTRVIHRWLGRNREPTMTTSGLLQVRPRMRVNPISR